MIRKLLGMPSDTILYSTVHSSFVIIRFLDVGFSMRERQAHFFEINFVLLCRLCVLVYLSFAFTKSGFGVFGAFAYRVAGAACLYMKKGERKQILV